MITKEGLISRLEKESIKVDIFDFEHNDDDNFVWFAFSFEVGHLPLGERCLDLDKEDDVLICLCGDDGEDYQEAINAIKLSKISAYKDCMADVIWGKDA